LIINYDEIKTDYGQMKMALMGHKHTA